MAGNAKALKSFNISQVLDIVYKVVRTFVLGVLFIAAIRTGYLLHMLVAVCVGLAVISFTLSERVKDLKLQNEKLKRQATK